MNNGKIKQVINNIFSRIFTKKTIFDVILFLCLVNFLFIYKIAINVKPDDNSVIKFWGLKYAIGYICGYIFLSFFKYLYRKAK